jgi:hypothetical protein
MPNNTVNTSQIAVTISEPKRAKRTSAQKALGKAHTNELFRDIATEHGAYLSTIQALSEKYNTFVLVGVLSLLLTLPCF